MHASILININYNRVYHYFMRIYIRKYVIVVLVQNDEI